METVVINLSGKVRRDTLHGREHLVAPCTLIVPGVLNGSRGPLYYPAAEIAENYEAWNHMPLVVYHPNSNGQHISARSASVLNEQGVGVLLNAKIGKNGALKGEAWFDVERVEAVDNRILTALQGGKKIELSTGLYTTNYATPGVVNGRMYDYVARKYKPDHLAILPDQVGACSLKDGCGILVNQSSNRGEYVCHCTTHNEQEQTAPAKKKKGAVGLDEDEELPGDKSKKKSKQTGIVGNASADSSLEERREEIREAFYTAYPSKYDSKTGRLLQSPYLLATYDDYLIFCLGIVGPYDPYGPSIVDDDLYKQAYTTDASGEVSLKGEPKKVDKVVSYVPSANSIGDIHVAKMSAETRKAVIDDLVANCDCWKNEGDDAILNAMSDERLIAAKKKAEEDERMITVANKAANGFEVDGKKFRVNPDTGKWEAQGAKKKPVANVDPNEEEEGDEGEAPPAAPPKRTENRTPRSDEEAIRNLPAHLRDQLEQANQINNREKQKIVEQILANSDLTNDQKYSHGDLLMKKSLTEIEGIYALMPKKRDPVANTPAPKVEQTQNYGDEEDDDTLAVPTSEWNSLEDEEEPKPKPRKVVSNRQQTSEVDLNALDPQTRREVLEYRRMVANEKQNLIATLTANAKCQDDEEERILTNRLNGYDIQILRDMAKMAPKKEDRNYFGSQGAPATISLNRAGSRNSLAPDDDDVLLPPDNSFETRKQA